MSKRPTAVTVICWILIVMGGVSLITSTVGLGNPKVKELMSRSPIPIPIQLAMMYLGMLVTIMSAIAMLKCQNWARYLYVIWGIVGFGIGVATSPMKVAMIPGFLVFLVITFFLFRPQANEYFACNEVKRDKEEGG